MKLTEMKAGMNIRVSNNLDKTDNAWTVTGGMRKMKGGIYKVRRIGETSASIYDSFGGAWTFSPDDLLKIEVTPPPPPVIFDPNSLDI